MKNKLLMLFVVFILSGFYKAGAQFQLDLETGLAISGYNDVRIPGDTGTKFSLSEELKTDPNFFFRLRLFYAFNDKHTIGVLVAPLRLQAEGKVDRPISYMGEEFLANTPLKSTYRFDSYRFTYRYNFHRSEKWHAGIGLTAKIRDASISVAGGGKSAEKKNTGFVPLINFKLQWVFANAFHFILDGDALAAPQGRAEDVLFALGYNPSQLCGIKLGYRILEGGADNDEVYTFSLIHYIVIGATINF